MKSDKNQNNSFSHIKNHPENIPTEMQKTSDTTSLTLTRELELVKFSKPSSHPQVSEILNGHFHQYLKDHMTDDLAQFVVNNSVEGFNKTLEDRNEAEQLDILMIGISSLYAFIQFNWTGPREMKTSDEESYLDEIKLDDKRACELLNVDSIEFSTIPRQPKLLLLARFLLSANYTKLSSAAWWNLRVLHIHQSLLDENSSQLFDRIECLARCVLASPLLASDEDLKLAFSLELVHVYLTYGVIGKSQQTMREIDHMSDMSIELKGALGKRTKWQQKNIAQLLLDITFDETKSADKVSSADSPTETCTSADTHSESLQTFRPAEFVPDSKNQPTASSKAFTDNTTLSANSNGEVLGLTEQWKPTESVLNRATDSKLSTPNSAERASSTEECSTTEHRKLPHSVNLDDDTRLETIAYEATTRLPSLSGSQQAVLYTSLVHKLRCQPKDDLRQEELRPYIDALLAQECLLWSARYGTLYLRSKLEADHRRTVERSMMQLEELRASLSKETPSCRTRLEGFFISWIPSVNSMETTLARVFASLGDIKSALLIHESLHHWEEMISCYNLLQLRHLSERIIREQLAVGETPKLYCLLGDATDEVAHYHTAWSLSGERSARAMKSLGLYYFKRKEYAEAIPYLQKSLEVNSIQIDLWSRLGYAALQCEDRLEVACSAYNRYVSLEPDDFQGWNNLARAYLDRGQKLRAYNALVEAVRTSNMDNWKVIENLMRVALDVGHFECALRNYSHLLDIKPKHLDIEVLSILVRALSDNMRDAGLQNSARNLLANALRLFGRLTSAILNDADLWWLYAKLNTVRDNAQCVAELRRTLKFVTHAQAIRMRDERSTRDAQGSMRLSEICALLCDVTTDLARVEPALPDRRQIIVTSKMALKSTLVAMEREGEVERTVRESLERVESLLAL